MINFIFGVCAGIGLWILFDDEINAIVRYAVTKYKRMRGTL